MMEKYCTFYINGLYFGINVISVQEVMSTSQIEAIPLTSRVVRGLINLRGQIITVIDLRERLGYHAQPSRDNNKHIVVKAQDELVSFEVDEICDVLDVDDEVFEPTPSSSLSQTTLQFIQGAYKLEEELLLILDVDKAIDLCNMGRAMTC